MTSTSDGSFELYYRRGWAYLTVHAPTDGGRPVYHEDVQSRTRLLGVPHVPGSTLREIVERADGVPVALVEWPAGEALASRITVTVSEDLMTATVTATPPMKGAADPDRADLAAALEAAGVVHGIDEDALGRLVHERLYNEDIVVARGTEPVHARSAAIRYHFDPHRGKPYLVMEFDRINLRELNFIENKEEGDLLAEVLPPVTPEDGRNVYGQPVPANRDVVPVELTPGPNTVRSEDGTRIHAEADGNVRLVDGAVTIEPLVTVESVDYQTGNIRFDGSVVVEKDVADGFTIEAGGDVQVGRGVGRATIRAGGNVLLKTGVNGGGACDIDAEGNIFAKYVEGATLRCHGNLFVEEAIMHSHVTVWKHCVLNGRRSEIIGSTLVVGDSLWCKKLGSVAEAPVHVSMGIPPDLLLAFREARGELDTRERRLDQAQQEIEQIDRALVEGRQDDRLYTARSQLLEEMERLRAELPEQRHAVHELREQLQASRRSRLVVEDTIFKGAVVLFGTREYHAPEKGARKTVLRNGTQAIVEEGFNPADKPTLEFEGERPAPGEPG